MPIIQGIASSQVLAVGETSQKFAAPMEPKNQYFYTCESDCWIHVGATGDSAQADTAGNIFVHAGQEVCLANLENSGTTNSFVHAIRQSADGDATLTQMMYKLV